MNNVALVTVATQQQVCTRRTMQPFISIRRTVPSLPPFLPMIVVSGVGCGVWGGVRVCAVAGVHPSRVSRAAVMIRFHANSETPGLLGLWI